MIDISTKYLGLKLKSPIVASASPLTESVQQIRQLEDAGAGAVVLHSLFEEQLQLESQDLDFHLSQNAESYAEALSYFPEQDEYDVGPESYLELIEQAKKAVDIPVIASLNGISPGGWIDYATKIEQAGADALELNIYYIPTDPDLDANDIEHIYLSIIRQVKGTVQLPLAVKISPFFSAMANMAGKLEETGASGLVLFNRFYQPDFDLENLSVAPNLRLSNSSELLLRLRWVAVLYSHIKADMAVTGGVHTATDVVKCMMAGATVAMMTSALLKHGIDYIKIVEKDMIEWMEDHEYESIEMMQGSMSQQSVAEPAAFERANYMRVLSSYTNR
jgi:dihydroorotate dehydrogenase (fumarate)